MLLMICPLFLCDCYIEEDYSLSELITGRWAFSGRTAFYDDGTSDRDLPLDVCEFETEFFFEANGTLRYLDYTERPTSDGTIDFCEENLLTDEFGSWEILTQERLRMVLENGEDGSDIVIEPFSVEVEDLDRLNIRYKESEEDRGVKYYIYHYFKILDR